MTLALPPIYDLAPDASGTYVMIMHAGEVVYDSRPKPSGFGLTMAMLDRSPPAKHPWLTVDLAAQEIAISARQADPEAVWQDSLS